MYARVIVCVCACVVYHAKNRTFADFYHFPYFPYFSLFIHIICSDILLLSLFFVLFVNVSDFFAYFRKFFAKKLAQFRNASYLCIRQTRGSLANIL